MKNYIALHKNSDLKINILYAETGVLQFAEFTGSRWTEKQVSYAIKNLVPITEDFMLLNLENRNLEFEFIKRPTDLSFKAFWDLYGNKVGKMVTTEKAWSKLTDLDKIDALLFIPKFKNKKQIDGTALPYPSTYLNQKYWLAEKY